MNPGIFLIQDNEELIEMTEQTYESEKFATDVARSVSGAAGR
jgi:hypothetical protein